ncbi:MAG: hypothetical protein J6P72_04665 [Firmicutes bacterium]|nr:hypothetical protein [Bacillota bacterium]
MNNWKSVWHYQMIGFGTNFGKIGRLRQHLMILSSVRADRLRLKLDNRTNLGQMKIESIRAGVSMDHLSRVSVEGADGAVLEPDEIRWTDETAIDPVLPGQALHIVIDFESLEGVRAFVQTTSNRNWNSEFMWLDQQANQPENQQANQPSAEPSAKWMDFSGVLPAMAGINKPTAAFGISQTDLWTDESVRTIALFGDSITHMSFYYDALFDRLLKAYPGKFVLENAGIGGNRLCYDASKAPNMGENYIIFGPAGYGRYPDDVFSDFKPDAVIILEGVNDVTHCWQFDLMDEIPTTELFCGRLAEIAAYTHEKGSKVFYATICPESAFAEFDWYDASEQLRTGINDWIRKQNLADGWFDFDLAVRDPKCPSRMKPECNFGDGLHPGTEGGRAMAASVDLCALMA